MSRISPAIAALASGALPDRDAVREAFAALMDGEAEAAEIGAFLVGLAALGETPEILAEGAEAMRARMTRVAAPEGAVDTCGTGGDAKGTWNVSTAAAIVAAGAGAVVAKHGNRAASSKSGSAEALEALGVDLAAPAERVERCFSEAGVGFLFAPAHHGAVRHVGPARKTLGVRTVFNLLGPLSNPAGAKRQLLGVFSDAWLEPMAEALRTLGAERAWVVHGADGLDELTTTGESTVCALEADGAVRRFTVTPEDAGLARASLDDLCGGEPAENARAIRELLDGVPGPYRDIVVLNAAAALILSDKAGDLAEGARLAEAAIDDGRAATSLRLLADTSRGER